jgi:hypothetical protein
VTSDELKTFLLVTRHLSLVTVFITKWARNRTHMKRETPADVAGKGTAGIFVEIRLWGWQSRWRE